MIAATDAQADYLEANWPLMEGYADQVIAHNIEYAKQCLGDKPRQEDKPKSGFFGWFRL